MRDVFVFFAIASHKKIPLERTFIRKNQPILKTVHILRIYSDVQYQLNILLMVPHLHQLGYDIGCYNYMDS